MNSEEVFAELKKDESFLKAKIHMFTLKMDRERRMKRLNLINQMYELVSPRNNNWLLYIRVSDKDRGITYGAYTKGHINFWMFPHDDSFCVHYTKHFLERYRERYLKDETIPIIKTIKMFTRANFSSVLYWGDKDIDNPKDGDQYIGRYQDGMVLGELERPNDYLWIFHHITYITFDMLKGEQIDIEKDAAEILNNRRDFLRKVSGIIK